MVACAITFNAKNITMGPVWMANANINEIASNANLWHRLAAHGPYLVHYEYLEIGIRLALSSDPSLEYAGRRVL